MAFTIRPTLKTDYKKPGDVYAVRIRLTRDSVARYYTTGINLKKTDWNKKATEEKINWVRTSHRDHLAINEQLLELVKAFRSLQLQHPTYSAEELRDAYGRKDQDTQARTGYIAFAREWIRRKYSMGQDGMAVTYETILKYFVSFWGDRPDDPKLLTPEAVGDLVAWMRSQEVRGKTGYDPSTINTAIRYFRTFFKHAILEGWLPPMPNPFAMTALTELEKPVVRPTVEQILSLMEGDVASKIQRHARNVFLMQYFLNGARVSEVITLRWSDITQDAISYHPKKKAKGRKIIMRHEGIEWVLGQYKRHNGYVFPYLTAEDEKLKGKEWVRRMQRLGGDVNTRLQRLCKSKGLPHMTTHMQRHTFAEQVWELTKNIRIVQGMVGHSTSRSTEVYMSRFGNAERDTLNVSLYGQLQKKEGPLQGKYGESFPKEQGETTPEAEIKKAE